MNKSASICALLAAAAVLISVLISQPIWLSDENTFLKNFINHELLAVTGVMLTITLGSAAQIHLKLNEIEERKGHEFLHKTRSNVKSGSYFLILIFSFCVLLVLLKPVLAETIRGQAFFNAMAIYAIMWMTLVIAAFTRLVFAIGPQFRGE